jgi:hypothetical protein
VGQGPLLQQAEGQLQLSWGSSGSEGENIGGRSCEVLSTHEDPGEATLNAMTKISSGPGLSAKKNAPPKNILLSPRSSPF